MERLNFFRSLTRRSLPEKLVHPRVPWEDQRTESRGSNIGEEVVENRDHRPACNVKSKDLVLWDRKKDEHNEG